MNLYEIMPANSVPLFAELGKEDWLIYEMRDDGNRSLITGFNFPKSLLNDPWIDQIIRDTHKDVITPYTLFVLSKAIAAGCKVICLSDEQAEAFEYVDINIPFADYHQPFPAIFIEIPNDYRQKLAARFNHPAPKIAVCFHDERTGYIMVVCDGPNHDTKVINLMPPRASYKIIEEALRQKTHDGIELEVGEVIQRIAVNACLMLTHLGVEELGPADPRHHRGLEKAVKKKKGIEGEKAAVLLAASPKLITFNQKIQLYHRVNYTNGPSDKTGVVVRPHWRRGHFRHQNYGPKFSQRKLIFIRPVMVNMESFQGDLADTSVEYRLPK